MLNTKSISEKTSAAVPQVSWPFVVGSIATDQGECKLGTIITRQSVCGGGVGEWPVDEPVSVPEEVYWTTVMANSPWRVLLVRHGGGAGTCSVFDGLERTVHHRDVVQAGHMRVIDTRDDAMAEFLGTTRRFAVGTVVAEVGAFVASMRRGEILESNDEFDALIAAAVEHRGAPENVAEWARRLASDVCDLDD